MEEVWKDIKDYEGLYKISNLGRIKSLKCWSGNKYLKKYVDKEKIIKPIKEKNGYLRVMLHKKGESKNKRVHRLVAETFINNPNNYPVINHIDSNKENNCVLNLEWCTQKHNVEEAINNNLRKIKYKGKCRKYITYDKRDESYCVRFLRNKKQTYLGRFKTIEEAVKIRNQFLRNNYIEIYNKICLLEN